MGGGKEEEMRHKGVRNMVENKATINNINTDDHFEVMGERLK